MATIDRDLVAKKFELLNDNLDKLDNLSKLPNNEFIQDYRNIDTVEHRIQTSIQVLIDLSAHICARLCLVTPKNSREIIEILAKNNLITQSNNRKYIDLVFFRNELVHEYNQIDANLLHKNLPEHIRTIKSFLNDIQKIVDKT